MKKIKNIIISLFISKPQLQFVDTDELYENSLYFTSHKPWALDDKGKFTSLEHRYNFVVSYLKNKNNFDYKNTDYHRFIRDGENNNFDGVHDGSLGYAITGADDICKRYIALTDSILEKISLYNLLDEKNILQTIALLIDDIISFERKYKKEVFYFKDKKIATQKENLRYNADDDFLKDTIKNRMIGHYIPSAIYSKNKLVVKNGCHRVALFKELKERGIFTNKFPVYIIS